MQKAILGIDISKKHFDVSLLVENKHKSKKFSNNSTGFKDLKAWIVKNEIDNIHACLEATGFYGEKLTEFLYNLKYKVSVVNPSCIKSYIRSKLCRHKTDKMDAKLIAEYCDKYDPNSWKPLPLEIKEIRELTRCIGALKTQCNQIINQLENQFRTSDFVSKIWLELKVGVEEKIKELYKEIDVLLSKNKLLNQSYNNLQTIPGIGKNTAVTLLAEIPDINAFKNARQLAAYAGLTPFSKIFRNFC